jgi:hypothetical protein
MNLNDILPQLKAWFPPEAHKERDLPGGGSWWFVPWQAIRDRLDEVCPDSWEVRYGEPQYLGDFCYVSCTLTLCGVSRQGVGSAEIQLLSSKGRNMARGNPIERAVADAFKNAAEQFGIAAYLDEQADTKTKQNFARYMHRAGNSKVAQQYKDNEAIARGEEPQRPQRSNPAAKPFGRAAVTDANTPITEAQVKRFYAIARTDGGFTKEGLTAFLNASELENATKIPRSQYDEFCKAVGDREQGQAWNEFAVQKSQEAV